MRSLTSRELLDLQEEIEDTLPDVCNLLTLSQVWVTGGDLEDTWGTVRTGVSCRLDPITPRGETYVAAGLQDITAWMLSLPNSIAITTDYRIEYGGNQYNVISLRSNGSWPLVKRAVVTRVIL